MLYLSNLAVILIKNYIWLLSLSESLSSERILIVSRHLSKQYLLDDIAIFPKHMEM